MKILLILEATLGGTARHVVDLARGLDDTGHEVHLAYSPERMDGIFRKGLERFEGTNIRAVPIPMRRAPGLHDIKAWRAIRAYLKSEGPFDVIHGHSSKAGAYARLCALGLPGSAVYTPHAFVTTNPELRGPMRYVYALSETVLGRLGDGLIAVSQEEFEHALRLRVPRRSLFLAPNGADLSFAGKGLLTRAGLGLSEGAVLLGFVGRLVPQKAPENLIRAFALVAPRFPQARLVIVGSGPLEAMAREEAARLGIAERIDWLGVQDGPSAMGLFDVFVLPSRYEGLPYVLIEAMAEGLPIVTTRIGGSGTLVEEGVNGYTVPHSRPDLLSDAMGKVLEDDALRVRMGRASREKSAYFSAARMVKDNLAVYSALAARSTPAPHAG